MTPGPLLSTRCGMEDERVIPVYTRHYRTCRTYTDLRDDMWRRVRNDASLRIIDESPTHIRYVPAGESTTRVHWEGERTLWVLDTVMADVSVEATPGGCDIRLRVSVAILPSIVFVFAFVFFWVWPIVTIRGAWLDWGKVSHVESVVGIVLLVLFWCVPAALAYSIALAIRKGIVCVRKPVNNVLPRRPHPRTSTTTRVMDLAGCSSGIV